MIKHNAETVDIYTEAEVSAEVERLRKNSAEIGYLIRTGVLRPWCYESDLRVEAYNRLTDKMCAE